jgi:hypothetical protein
MKALFTRILSIGKGKGKEKKSKLAGVEIFSRPSFSLLIYA